MSVPVYRINPVNAPVAAQQVPITYPYYGIEWVTVQFIEVLLLFIFLMPLMLLPIIFIKTLVK